MVIPSGFAQINAMYTGTGVPTGAQWTIGVDITLFAGEPLDLASAFAANVNTAGILDEYSSAVAINGYLVKFGPDATGPSALFSTSDSGLQASSATPPNVSVLIQKLTSQGGRAGRGRLYLPGPAEADVTADGLWAAANVAAQNVAWEQLRDKMVADDTPMVVLHGADSPLSLPTFIDSFSVQQKVATQRRRLRR